MNIRSEYLRRVLALAAVLLSASALARGVYAQSSNLAGDGTATQSSAYMAEGAAYKAIDGNTNGTWAGNSLTHTNYDLYAWWQVDLRSTYQIDQIKLWNRTDCCPERLSNYYVFVSDQPFASTDLNATLGQAGVSSYYFSAPAGSPTTFSVGRTGRYVRVQLAGTNYLTLAEVEIIGGSAAALLTHGFNGEKNNVALASNRATISASSTLSGSYAAANAINGDRKGKTGGVISYWNDATPSTTPEWVEITFADKYSINKVNVFSVQNAYRTPEEPDRDMTFTDYGLVDFRIEVWVGGAWAPISDGLGVVTGNNRVWRQITFPAVETTKIKLTIDKSADSWVRIAELEVIRSHQGCASPGDQQEELLSTIRNNYTDDAGTIYWDGYREEAFARWRKCLQPNFGAWENNGSQNLPVLAAAIGLFREGSSPMTSPGNLGRSGNPTYIKWWNDYLGCQVGALETTNKSLGHFKGTEIFSSVYDGHTVSAIVAVRYWASFGTNTAKPNASYIDDYARRYLRANWFVYGLAAGAGPAREMEIPNAAWTYKRFAPLLDEKEGNPPKYAGHFVAMAGSRSNADYMTEGQRSALFDRAIQYSNKAGKDGTYDLTTSNEARDQRLLLNYLNDAWASSGENLYGLTAADRTAFRNLIATGNVGYFNLGDWLNGINTFRTVMVLGWDVGGMQVRVSTLENNPNGNTPAMYAVKYEQATSKATFLYPWTNHVTAGKCHLAGQSTLYPDRVEASQPGVRKKPGCTEIVHPGRSATMTIPQGVRKFHLVLSRSQPAYWETAPQGSYPSTLPTSPWEEIPPGNDPDPPEN